MPKTFTRAEVAEHNNAESLWVVINNQVHDVTPFRSMHPGGPQVLLQVAGQDATEEAERAHGNSRKAKSIMSKTCIGTLAPEVNGLNGMKNSKAALTIFLTFFDLSYLVSKNTC